MSGHGLAKAVIDLSTRHSLTGLHINKRVTAVNRHPHWLASALRCALGA